MKLLFRLTMVVVIVSPIAYFLGIKPTLLLEVIISLAGLWIQRKQLPSVVRRAKVIIGVVFGTGLFFGLLLWYIYGDTYTALALVLGTTVIIFVTLGSYDHKTPYPKREDDIEDMTFRSKDQPLPIEEQ